MAKRANQKIKLLLIQRYLWEQTDEEHPASTEALLRMLAEHEIVAERKSVGDDIHTLQAFGMDIVHTRAHGSGYYVASREFELPELKILMDTMQSARFLTHKKAHALNQKLGTLCSRQQALQLSRQPLLTEHTKNENERIYYSVDYIHSAIAQNKQISCTYFHWKLDFQGDKRIVKEGNDIERIVSPWALHWDDKNYYMIAYDAENAQIRHYRVDKMEKIQLLDRPRVGQEAFAEVKKDYIMKTFSMFRGEEHQVKLLCDNALIGVVMERFGHNILPIPHGETQFSVEVPAVVSPQFFGWMSGFAGGISVIAPQEVCDQATAHLQKLQQAWQVKSI